MNANNQNAEAGVQGSERGAIPRIFSDGVASRTGVADRNCPSILVMQVMNLEEEAKQLRELSGEMLATMRVNLQRGYLTTQDDAMFERFLDAWSDRMAAAGGPT